MTINDVTPKLKEKFCKDCKIPIKIFKEPYFMNRLMLLDPYYDTMNKWFLFLDELSKYNTEQDFYEEYNSIKDNAIDYIKSTDAYNEFNSIDMNQFAVTHKNLPNKDIFKPSNDGKMFLSIDMKKANFSALRLYGDMFKGATTWEEFLSTFTTNKHIINSKYIRQVILGNCNPKRHITYEKYLMDQLLSKLLTFVNIDDVVFFSNDEIIIKLDNIKNIEYFKNKIVDITNNEKIPFRVEVFKLIKIGKSSGYAKCINGTYDFKCIDSNTIPFIIRYLRNEPVTDDDLVFVNSDGYLAKYIEYPEL